MKQRRINLLNNNIAGEYELEEEKEIRLKKERLAHKEFRQKRRENIARTGNVGEYEYEEERLERLK